MQALEPRLLLSAAELVFAAQPLSATTRTSVGTIVVEVEDASGNRVTTDHSKVALAIQSGPPGATINGTSVVFAKNGFATFKNVTLSKAGTYALIATDGALSPAVSGSFVIQAGATQLVISRQPVNGTSGSLFTVQYKLEDATGAVVTTDNSAVTLSVAAPNKKGHLFGTTTVNAVNGIATFANVSLPKAGSYQLLAMDAKLRSAASSTFVMAVGAAARLQILAVANVGSAKGALQHGAVGPVTVAVEDAFGNIVTTDASTVTLVLNTTLSTEATPGTVTQAQTATATVANGIATFSALTTEPSGWYTCIVSDGSLTSMQRLLFVR